MRTLFEILFLLFLVSFVGALVTASYWWAVGAALMVCVSLIGRILAN